LGVYACALVIFMCRVADTPSMGFFSRMKEKKELKEAFKEDQKKDEAQAKPEPKPKEEPKPTPKKEEPKEEPKADAKENDAPKNGAYFVSTHPDGGWQVKKAGAQKALKRFKTKAEAEEYAKTVAENQGTNVVRKKKDGKIQKKH